MANDPIVFFMEDAERDPDQFLDELVAQGKLAEEDRDRVLIVRHMTAAEAADAVR
jgi:predicted Rossmann-fold nucleotide-binding protein